MGSSEDLALLSLPSELQLLIASRLPCRDVIRLSSTCKRFQALICDPFYDERSGHVATGFIQSCQPLDVHVPTSEQRPGHEHLAPSPVQALERQAARVLPRRWPGIAVFPMDGDSVHV